MEKKSQEKLKNHTNKSPIAKNYRHIWSHLTMERKRQLSLLGVLVVFSSLAEVLSVGAILPFLAVLIEPEKNASNTLVQLITRNIGLTDNADLLSVITVVFIFSVILSGSTRALMLWAQTRLSTAIGADLSTKVYRTTLYQPYEKHLARNSSDVLSAAHKANGLVYSVIQPTLTIISSSVILVSLLGVLIFIDTTAAIAAFASFCSVYIVIAWLSKRTLILNSQTVAEQQTRAMKAIQEGLGGIRDVIIDGTQDLYAGIYNEAVCKLQRANARNQVAASMPRFVIETLAMILIATFAWMVSAELSQTASQQSAIPLIGALALGAQRLLPIVQQVYSSYVTIRGASASTADAIKLLDQELLQRRTSLVNSPLVFGDRLLLENVSFRYDCKSDWLLRNLNLEIKKGARVAIIGESGTGKSTLLDILMGLIKINDGQFLIDNQLVDDDLAKQWMKRISHVPQSIYLSDTTIARNVAFGVPQERIEMGRVEAVIQQVNLRDMIEKLPLGYQTVVGERGVRLSGGQRQRLGIARALYKQADVVFLDEPTNALDTRTQSHIVQSLHDLSRDITIVLVTHHLDSTNDFDFVYELRNRHLEVANLRSNTAFSKIHNSKVNLSD